MSITRKPHRHLSKYTFILNPQAGKGAGLRLRERVYKAAKEHTSDFELIETSAPGDATRIARDSSSTSVVAVGGDGTVHEIANGILGTEKVLGIIPVGSGNDFIKSIGIPKDIDEATSCLFLQRVARVDVGRLEIRTNSATDQGNSSQSIFVNGVGIGFDAAVAERTHHISWMSGSLLYIIAVLQTLGRYKSPEFVTSVDGRKRNSRNLLIAVGNGRCAGGGFYLTPDAKVDDAMLDICLIDDISTFSIVKLMPRVMRGNHGKSAAVKFERGKQISVCMSSPVSVHADGEILGNDVVELKIVVVPGALSVIVGRTS